jgi:hypothetical protein
VEREWRSGRSSVRGCTKCAARRRSRPFPAGGAVKVTAPRVGGEGVSIPLLDGIGRIGQHDIEAHEAVALYELRLGECVAANDLKVFDAMEEAVHTSDSGGHEIPLLTVETDVAPLTLVVA